MKEFTFALEQHAYLQEKTNGFFLISKTPLRILRLNRALFLILKQIQNGDRLSELIYKSHEENKDILLKQLLSLTSKGYLKLAEVAEPESYPAVSIIIPVKDRPEDIVECLQSLSDLNYPEDKMEVIVVDDGSKQSISDIVSSFNAKLIKLEESQGASVCRNIGAHNAGGDILAFLDADCIADKNWLREIVPFIQIEGIGAVGGLVDSYYHKSQLDRYEEAFSSLSMGKRLIFQGNTESSFYVPSCNLLVTSAVFRAMGGFKKEMHVGEDVDLCWRIRKNGHILLYVPAGKVAHKHRNKLFKMLQRRKDYGTSEAPLYYFHRDKKKRFPISIFAMLSLLALITAILLRNPYIACFIVLFFGIDLYRKSINLKRQNFSFPLLPVIYSVLRSYFAFYYFASFHFIRYYLILLIGLGFVFHFLWVLCGAALLLTSIIDYRIKKPDLFYPVFFYFYTLEHLAYQTGVFWGCLKLKHFRAYIPAFSPAY
ncbi:MAG: mycofactocin biosynthesis glycosyltransferase MftF [Dehalococcoidia bacterium]